MVEKNSKIIVKDIWSEKFLRESNFMPFGSMCNLIGQAYQSKGITIEELEKLSQKAFELAMEFTEKAYNRVSQSKEEKDLPVKK